MPLSVVVVVVAFFDMVAHAFTGISIGTMKIIARYLSAEIEVPKLWKYQ